MSVNDSSVVTITDASFETAVLQSTLPVLVDFWAEWCGPCKSLSPIIEAAAKQYTGKVILGKLNVDDNQKTPAKYGVRGIPTLILFKDGAVLATKVGLLNQTELDTFLEGYL
jgi:thioredoxin 1